MPYRDGAHWQASYECQAASRENKHKRLSLTDMPPIPATNRSLVGAGLLANAVANSTHSVAATPHSRASPLPQV
ncbi:hypothetical protein EMIT0347P_30660 [Pseudomonas sp. IT-347P]